MKLLRDENLPHCLRGLLVGHDVFTVAFMNWKGVGNGELLKRAADNGFDALPTKDNGLPYEQNAASLPCSIVVIRAASNSLQHIKPLVPEILSRLPTLAPRSVVRIG